MEVLSYILAVLVGISLGLIGAGGSILTVPILVYILGLDAVVATGYSLFIVGATYLVGAVRSYFKQQVDIKTALFFGIPSIISAILVRTFVIPLIPAEVLHFGSFTLTKHIFLLVLFAVVMIIASINMIKPLRLKPDQRVHYFSVVASGFIVGTLTGLVGAGGGFLIIPALVLFLHLPMKKAIGTSLLLITMNCLSSFAGSLAHSDVNWKFLLIFAACSAVGVLIGMGFSNKFRGEKLKPVFGWVILLMGIYIILKELVLK